MAQNLYRAFSLMFRNLLEVSTRRSRLLPCPLQLSRQTVHPLSYRTDSSPPPSPDLFEGISAARLNNDKVFTVRSAPVHCLLEQCTIEGRGCSPVPASTWRYQHFISLRLIFL